MRGPLCRAVPTYSTYNENEESPQTIRLMESGISIEFVDLSFDEANEAEITEGIAEQQYPFVLFGVMQDEDTDDRPFEGLILRLPSHHNGKYQRVGAFRIDD